MKNIIKIVKKIRKRIQLRINKIGCKKRYNRLENRNVTIISNNCFAGITYEYLNLPYYSPTIGLYFFAPDYIKFIYNLKHYIKIDLKQITAEESKYYNELKRLKQENKIIGKLDDIEIVFLHYNSFEEAKIKWNKRCKRINFDNIVFKFNDQNLCTEKELLDFNNFNAPNKICFTSKRKEYDNFIWLKKYQNKEFVKEDSFYYHKYFNIIDYLNNTKIKIEKKEQKKKVSIVIPTYSRPISLSRTIDSVLSQSYKNIEIIVVDDNNPNTESRKETEDIMKNYKNYTNIKYIKHNKNKNGSAARNTGWKNSTGDYITFLDDDDVISKNRIEIFVNTLENLDESWGMCYSGYEIINDDNIVKSLVYHRGNCYIEALMKTLYMGSGSNLFLRKSVVDEIGGYDESFKRNQDLEFLTRATKKYKIECINKCLLTIYRNNGSRIWRTVEEMDEIDQHYFTRFNNDINSLSKKEKKRVRNVMGLEKFRYALMIKDYSSAIKILKKHKISFTYFFNYLIYLIKRKKTHLSYGFDGKS